MCVFHLNNTSATCELSVYLDGQRFRHECHPTSLGVSYREHLTKTAGKLKNRNNLLMKLAGSTWGASGAEPALEPPAPPGLGGGPHDPQGPHVTAGQFFYQLLRAYRPTSKSVCLNNL